MKLNQSLVLAAACVAATVGLTAVPAVGEVSATARPAFEMPFPCGEQWQGKTYDGHGDNDFALDLNQGAGSDDRGEEVVASAAGTVQTRIAPRGNHIVEVVHGGGWSTEYRHFDRFDVADGQYVEQGELVGHVGNTGESTSPHLHYEQQYNNVSQHIYWHGSAITYYKGSGNGPTFTSQNCGHSQFPGVAATTRGGGGIDLFMRANDATVWHRNWNGTQWQWADLGGLTIADPAAVATGSSRLDVFVLGTDNRLYVKTWTAGVSWTGWRQLATNTFTSSPTATKRYDGGIDLFARGANGDIIHGYYNLTTGAVTFANLGGEMTSAPIAIASESGDRMTVFARGANGHLMSKLWTSTAWYSWVDRGVSIIGRPGVTSRGGATVDLFYRDTDDTVVHWYSPDAISWTSDRRADLGGGKIYAPPAAQAHGTTRIDLFSRNDDGHAVQRTWIAGDQWDAWHTF
jgi:hypothetical protein